MNDVDILGYSRSKVGTVLYSSDYAAIYFANSIGGPPTAASKAGLVQSAAVSYQHAVQPRFEAGSHELYWVTGQALGTVQLARVIGDKGFLAGIQFGDQPNDIRKGVLGGVEMKVGRLGLQGIEARQEVLMMSGCVLSGVSMAFSVGGLEIQESLRIETAMLRRGLRQF